MITFTQSSIFSYEFLIIDDCSTDESTTLIQSYKDDRIKLIINEENIGQSNTMNRGIKLARGKYIARLDQDDLCRDDQRIDCSLH